MIERTSQLDYAPPPAPAVRRRTFRQLCLVLAIVVLMMAVCIALPRLWSNARVMVAQSQWMTFLLPATQVVVEPDERKAAALCRGQSDYMTRSSGIAYHVPNVSSFVGDCVFLHGRRTPKGNVRLVKVSAELELDPPGTLTASASRPATILNSPKVLGLVDSPLPPGRPGERPRLYAGQPDLQDPSRFTIRYEYTDRNGVIGGTLQNDDSIMFEIVVDPAKKGAKP